MIRKLYGYGGIKIGYNGTYVTFAVDKAYGQIQLIEDSIMEQDEDGNWQKKVLGYHLQGPIFFEHLDSTDTANIMEFFRLYSLASAAQAPMQIYPRFNSAAINSLGLDVWIQNFNIEEPDRIPFYEKLEAEFLTKTRMSSNPIRVDVLDVQRLVTAAGNKLLTASGNYIAVIPHS